MTARCTEDGREPERRESAHAGRLSAMAWRTIALGLAMVAGGCASALNYLDASGPRYMGQHAGATPAGSDVHVVTFNIAHSRRIPEAIAILRAQAPLRNMDVLALQEMDAPGVQAIAQAMGRNYV